MPCLCASDLEAENFLNLVNSHSFPVDAILVAFSPAEAKFENYSFEEHKKFLSQTEQGRIFSPHGELKWRRLDGRIRVVYLGNESPLAGLENCSKELTGLAFETGELFLWGIRTDLKDEWLEQQTPRRFIYPNIEKNFPRGRVILVVEKWMDSNGIIKFSRYKSIKEIEGEK